LLFTLSFALLAPFFLVPIGLLHLDSQSELFYRDYYLFGLDRVSFFLAVIGSYTVVFSLILWLWSCAEAARHAYFNILSLAWWRPPLYQAIDPVSLVRVLLGRRSLRRELTFDEFGMTHLDAGGKLLLGTQNLLFIREFIELRNSTRIRRPAASTL
jgi:hypothetical protein